MLTHTRTRPLPQVLHGVASPERASRRLYDVSSVLVALNLLEKRAGAKFAWLGADGPRSGNGPPTTTTHGATPAEGEAEGGAGGAAASGGKRALVSGGGASKRARFAAPSGTGWMPARVATQFVASVAALPPAWGVAAQQLDT